MPAHVIGKCWLVDWRVTFWGFLEPVSGIPCWAHSSTQLETGGAPGFSSTQVQSQCCVISWPWPVVHPLALLWPRPGWYHHSYSCRVVKLQGTDVVKLPLSICGHGAEAVVTMELRLSWACCHVVGKTNGHKLRSLHWQLGDDVGMDRFGSYPISAGCKQVFHAGAAIILQWCLVSTKLWVEKTKQANGVVSMVNAWLRLGAAAGDLRRLGSNIIQ